MKIALPARGSQIDGHFGHCEHFRIFTTDGSCEITHEETLVPPAGCGCKSAVAAELAGMGVTLLIAGNMGDGAVNKLAAQGISVIRGIEGEPRSAVESFISGKLADSGKGCSAHEHGSDCSHHG